MINYFKSKQELSIQVQYLLDKVRDLEGKLADKSQAEQGLLFKQKDLEQTLTVIRKERSDFEDKYNKTLKLVREQTEADLYLVAEKIKQEILNYEKPTKESHDRFNVLLDRQRALGAQSNISQHRLLGLSTLAGLGLQSVL